MDPKLLAFGIQATLRAAQAGADLLGEHARDRKVFLPNLELPTGSRTIQLQRFLSENQQLAISQPELSVIWDAEHKQLTTTKTEQIDTAYAFMLQQKATLQLISDGTEQSDAKRKAEILAAGRMVEQWREERRPPNAVIRMALTLTDIGLEFIGSNPSILGVGSRGEKLVAAFANNMSALIPEDMAAFGSKTDFADRVLGIFFRAGLGALADNASTAFKDEDVANLIKGVTKPIVEALPDSIEDQILYRDLVDVLAGPSAEAAFYLLAENTKTYLGKNFADHKALGVVTSALFQEIMETAAGGSIVEAFSEQGLIRLYQAGLGVALERPGLFVGEDEAAKTRIFRDLLRATAGTLRAHPRLKGSIGASLAAVVVDIVGKHAPALLKLNRDAPWEKVAEKVLIQVTTELSIALNQVENDGSLKGALRSFSDGQLLELGRVILEQVAQTPGMLGIERSEVQAIVAGMAEAMAADDNLLLSADEWIEIAGIAARKAASNPGRLFGLSAGDHGQALAIAVMKSVLEVAGDFWTQDGRKDFPLLFGETLEAALVVVVEALAGNVSALVNQPDLVNQFLRRLLKKVSEESDKFGSDGLLKVFRAFIGTVLAKGTLPTDNEIDDALSK